MTSKQKTMIEEIEDITSYKFELENISAYDFIGKYWKHVLNRRSFEQETITTNYLDNHVFQETPMGGYSFKHDIDYDGFDPR